MAAMELLDLEEKVELRDLRFVASDTGTPNAVVYWLCYEFKRTGKKFETRSSASYNQAAFVLNHCSKKVERGDPMLLCGYFSGDFLGLDLVIFDQKSSS